MRSFMPIHFRAKSRRAEQNGSQEPPAARRASLLRFIIFQHQTNGDRDHGLDPELSDDVERWSRRLNLDPAPMHHCRAGYYGLVNHVDMQLNRLFQYMRDRRLLNDTFIMFASDHGEMLGDHHLFAKTWPYEASTRVPFLARAPRSMKFPRQVQVAAPVGLQDVMPTLLDVAGCEIPESVTGRSVLPWMRGETPEWRDVLHGEHAGQYREADGNHWIVNERHRYTWFSQADSLVVGQPRSKFVSG